jgi:16S rRNA (uracil1498-N3)-methyltransferase
MIRLFLPPETLTSKKIKITDENARYLFNVLRINTGEILMIFDGSGHRYLCRALKVHRKEVLAEKIKEEKHSVESPLRVTIAQGIPKGEKMEMIIQKSTELGVKRVIPLITKRSQVKHTEKISRWRKIATSASQQSGREIIPVIEEPVDFREFINRAQRYRGIIFYEEEKQRRLKEILKELYNEDEIFLLIGPEGGFSGEEVDQSIKRGFITASLGPRILRAETAAITALSLLQYELGDMG